MTTIFAILSFVFGAMLGSFSSVLIARLHKKEKGSFFGRSKCPKCKKILPLRSLIPLISYIFQGGKCSMCEQKISPHYPLIELFFAASFLGAFYKFLPHLQTTNLLPFAFYLIIFSFLGLIFFYDLKYKEIPDRFSLPPLILALAYNLTFSNFTTLNILSATGIIAGFFLLQFILSKGRVIGGGDIRLGALMGAFLGLEFGLTALTLAYLVGGLFALYLIVFHRVKGKSEIAFGPFLTASTIVVALYGNHILEFYFQHILGL